MNNFIYQIKVINKYRFTIYQRLAYRSCSRSFLTLFPSLFFSLLLSFFCSFCLSLTLAAAVVAYTTFPLKGGGGSSESGTPED